MNNSNQVQFKKQREIGDVLKDTFRFIRENYKPLLKYIYKYSGPYFIILVATLGYYSYTTVGNAFSNLGENEGNFIISLLVMLLGILIFYASLYSTVLNYIKSYVQHHGNVIEEEVKSNAQKDFSKLLLLFFIIFILCVAGIILFIIPGIYLAVPLALAAPVLVFKNLGVSESISYCFKLIKEHWWITFITLAIIWILVYVISLAFQMPLIIYTVVKTITVVQEGSSADPNIKDWVLISLTVLSSLIQYVLSAITIVTLAFIYFNLNEHKHLTGTYETIEKLGE